MSDPNAESGQAGLLECAVDSEPSAGEPELLLALRDLTGLLLAADTVEGVLRRIVVTARHAIPGADLVSVTIRHGDGTFETPAGTGVEAADLDQAQYEAGDGPCVAAADPAGPAYALCNDLAGEDAWPTFTASATAHGYASVLSTAMLSGREHVPFTGALNIYSRQRDRFGDSTRDVAILLATQASLALAMVYTRQTLAETESVVVNLRRALRSRTIIGQATGILMARRKISANQAFDVLRRTSQNRNVKLAEMAVLLTEEPDITDHL